jgi:hypothetical protein
LYYIIPIFTPYQLLLRKIVSIVLLTLLLFNIIGYRAWFYVAEMEQDAALEARLDREDYDEHDLVSVVVPLRNPYQLEQMSFARVNGEISVEGKTYKYVKRRIVDGNMILLCIPDHGKMLLKKGQSDYGNENNELTATKNSPSRPGILKVFTISDYLDQDNFLHLGPSNPLRSEYKAYQPNFFSDPVLTAPGQPPQVKA